MPGIIRLGAFSPSSARLAAPMENVAPEYRVEINEDSTAVTFSLRIPTVEVTPDEAFDSSRYRWDVKNLFPSVMEGAAALPQRTLVFRLPGNAENIRLTENNAKWETISDFPPTPVQPLMSHDNEMLMSRASATHISRYSDPNSQVAEISNITRQRKSKLIYVHIEPFKHDAKDGSVKACYDFSYTISFEKSSAETAQRHALPLTAPEGIENVRVDMKYPFDYSGKSVVRDSLSMWPITKVYECESHRRPSNYLIFTTNRYYHTINEYAEWKRMLGHRVKIYSTDKWTPDLISYAILSNYNQGIDLHYVLFAGSIDEIPAANSTLQNPTGTSDFPYGAMEIDGMPNPGWEREIFTGRLLCDTPQEMANIVTKLKKFYKIGADNPSYHLNAAHVALFDTVDSPYAEGRMMVRNSEEVMRHMFSNGKRVKRVYWKDRGAIPRFWFDGLGNKSVLPEYLRYPGFPWDADSLDIIDAFRNGNHYMLFNCHGSGDSWGEDHHTGYIAFNSTSIPSLNNANNLPFVFSMACSTGSLSHPNGLAKKLLSSSNGASGVIASTVDIAGNNVPAMELGIFKTIWPTPKIDTNLINIDETINLDPFEFGYDSKWKRKVNEDYFTLGNILDLAQRYGYFTHGCNETSYNQSVIFLRSFFHIFGDPGLFFNTETPTEISPVRFRFRKNMSPQEKSWIYVSVDSASIIGFYNETTGEVSRYYHNNIEKDVSVTDKFHIVILQHNKIPFEFHVDNGTITASGPCIGAVSTIPFVSLNNVSQNAPNSIKVEYHIEEMVLECDAMVSVKNINGDIIAMEEITEPSGEMVITSPRLTQGIYVVSIESKYTEPIFNKILMR